MTSESPIKVLVVDDSAVVRGMVIRILQAEPAIEVKATAANGQLAIDTMRQQFFDVVLLDVEMPVMSGIEALPEMVKLAAGAKIVMNSTLTVEGAEVTLTALRLGAADYIAKPSSRQQEDDTARFTQELRQKVLELGRAAQRTRQLQSPATASAPAVNAVVAAKAPPIWKSPLATTKPGLLRPKALAFGCSTGGPQALFSVFDGIRKIQNIPIFITQHMPAGFTRILAEHLTKASGRNCQEAADGEAVTSDRVYVAPGNYHMSIEGTPENARIRLLTTPPENFCRPSVDPMLRSLSKVYDRYLLTVILTGMGQDGLHGSKVVVEHGGMVIAQDEATSVVWGMPGAVAKAGICREILPLPQVSGWLNQAFGVE